MLVVSEVGNGNLQWCKVSTVRLLLNAHPIVCISKLTKIYFLVGGTYKFRVVAVYINNDNKQGPNSARFKLEIAPALRPLAPSNRPMILTAKPLSYGTIQITWRVSNKYPQDFLSIYCMIQNKLSLKMLCH